MGLSADQGTVSNVNKLFISMHACRLLSIETGEGNVEERLNCSNEVEAWKKHSLGWGVG